MPPAPWTTLGVLARWSHCSHSQGGAAVGAAPLPTCKPTGGRDAAPARAPCLSFPPGEPGWTQRTSLGVMWEQSWGVGWDLLLAPAPSPLPALVGAGPGGAQTPSAEMRQNQFCAPAGVLPAPRGRGVCSHGCCSGRRWSWAAGHCGCRAHPGISARKSVPKGWPSALCWWPGCHWADEASSGHLGQREALLCGRSLTAPLGHQGWCGDAPRRM